MPDWNKPFNVSPQEFSRVHEEAMNKTRFAADRIRVLRGRTKDVVRHIEDDSLDFVYVDGDHTLRGITIDLITLFPKIKAGGFLAGDDFTNVSWQHSSDFEPTLVCPFAVYFAEAVDCPVFALPHNQFLVIKDLNSDFLFTDTTGNYSDLSVNRPPHQSRGLENMLKRRLSRLRKQKRGSQRTH